MMSQPRTFSKNKTNFRARPKAAKPILVRNRDWSNYQKDIFQFVENNDRKNAFVEALAGTGKTTTLEETVRRIVEKHPSKKVAVVSFNKDIKQEVESRLSDLDSVQVMTCHSLGYRFARASFKCGKPDQFKVNRIIESLIGNQNNEYFDQIKDCVSKVKLTLSDLNSDSVDRVSDKFEIDLGVGNDRIKNIDVVLKTLDLCKKQKGIVDFDDMLWLPLQLDAVKQLFDTILVDEVQDLNRSQFQLIKRSLKKGGNIIAFGDRNQRIFGFAGADEEVIPTIIEEMNATILPLSITYRCPVKVVNLAQEIVPEIQAAPNALEGTVEKMSFEKSLTEVMPGDFYISRKNAPLVKICMTLIRRGIPANIRGSDISKGLLWLIKKSQAKNVENLIQYIEAWRSSEKERLAEKRRSTDWIDDKADCLISFCESADSIEQVKSNIYKTFNDGGNNSRVVLSSIHRIKGAESKRVFILTDTLGKGSNPEEQNLAYVGYTRAKESLFLVSGLP